MADQNVITLPTAATKRPRRGSAGAYRAAIKSGVLVRSNIDYVAPWERNLRAEREAERLARLARLKTLRDGGVSKSAELLLLMCLMESLTADQAALTLAAVERARLALNNHPMAEAAYELAKTFAGASSEHR